MSDSKQQDTLDSKEIMKAFEDEVEELHQVCGVNPEKNPLRWIKWETQYKSPNGTRAPTWREPEGDLGYVIASTHDKGILVLLCKNNKTCYVIKGYVVLPSGEEELCYDAVGSPQKTLTDALSEASEIFKERIKSSSIQDSENESSTEEQTENTLVSLPQPVLVLKPPSNDTEKDEENEAEDDEPLIAYSRQPPQNSDNEYWSTFSKMRTFAGNPADPAGKELQEVASSANLKDPVGQRAVLDANALPAMLDVLRIKQAQHAVDVRQGQQAEAVVKILAQITVSPNVRRHIANDDTVSILLEILKKEEKPLMSNLFTIIANCCKNKTFRQLIIKHEGVEPLIYQIKNPAYASQVCFVLYALNRSEQSTQVMLSKHLDHELQKCQQSEKMDDELMLNITRLLYSIAYYDKETRNQLTREQVVFFCQGLASPNPELVSWSAKAFKIFNVSDELTKPFISQSCDGPAKLIKTLDNPSDTVVLAGLESIAVVGQIDKIRTAILEGNILPKLQNLWASENTDIRKGTLKALGVLNQHPKCAKWTVRQNLMPDLINYLNSTDPEFVIYSAKAIGSCCSEKQNLKQLIELNGIRILWSLMKSPHSGVQAAATRALVPFLKDESSPDVVRTFVDGLDLLVDLLRSNDPDVQASACMAITEVARDQENLAVMTDLGLVELLSRLLSTKLDSVRKPLADAIGVSATWGNNRRRFGEEGAVDPLVSYLRPPSNNKEVHAATAKALKALSEDPENSNKLRHAGVVDYLLIMVESRDQDLQMAAAVAIRNIRTNCVRKDN
ncbi:Armadillo/beta-catenin-like repeat family protein [Histomonas meleagridis]|uniref:Armadillo/beta-catenin-like repeat family protein n=1 Tax=Histomonas meleagridis TaxID=135588 RepID=UPI00355A545C|nr:Armadillo/beta-catenin-like repeat family protein [Histomonas meleagridis]KAH0806548.1 Armadillo/beta-catenin-like repeat family protein [Histomonas meleagridis]